MRRKIKQTSSADWRAQLRKNERRTRHVMILFILIYIALGILIDIVIYTGSPYSLSSTTVGYLTVSQALHGLLTLQLTPYATVTMSLVALLSILLTYRFHDKIILMGTHYTRITENSASLEEKQLYNIVEEMKVAAGLRYMPKVFIIEADYMNAFASGYSEKSALIAITRGLLQKLDRAETQAVMAHELSHIRHHDIKLTLMASVLSSLMLIAIDILFYSVLFGRNRRGDGRLIFVIILLRYFLPVITVLLMMYLSRTREYMADAGCVELTRDNEPLARALLKINQDYQENSRDYQAAYQHVAHEELRRAAYLYDPSQAGLSHRKSVSDFFSTHPSLEERLAALGYEVQHEQA